MLCSLLSDVDTANTGTKIAVHEANNHRCESKAGKVCAAQNRRKNIALRRCETTEN
jgi:hypothetical protein